MFFFKCHKIFSYGLLKCSWCFFYQEPISVGKKSFTILIMAIKKWLERGNQSFFHYLFLILDCLVLLALSLNKYLRVIIDQA
jgi:hypothetical protein